MIDINHPDFAQNFELKDATVGQVGYGFIGNSVVELFRPFCKVVIYDKAGYGDRPLVENTAQLYDIDGVVSKADVIFVAVPTPMKPTGECHTGIVESVLQDIQNAAMRIARDLRSFIVVIKSTVPPGFTQQMKAKFRLRIIFSPEFLTEANAVKDFKTANRVILGGDLDDADVVYRFFAGVWPDRLDPTTTHPDGPVTLLQCEPTVAEMVKLSTNVHLTAKVMISNELYLICKKLGISYEAVKVLTQLDKRIGTSHMNVPGPDGHLGYGGHCFVKDTQSLAFISEELGCSSIQMGEDPNLFRALHQRNLQIRVDRDWEAQKGRAVVDE